MIAGMVAGMIDDMMMKLRSFLKLGIFKVSGEKIESEKMGGDERTKTLQKSPSLFLLKSTDKEGTSSGRLGLKGQVEAHVLEGTLEGKLDLMLDSRKTCEE